MSVICRYCDVSALSDADLFLRGMKALPWQTRRESIMRLRFDKDRRLSLGAGLLAAYALRQAGAECFDLWQTENHKPFLAAHPEIHFNLSHSGKLAVCAVSDQPVGVDVEELRQSPAGVAQHCFQPRELAWMNASRDRDLAFFRLWTRKESFLKLSGIGLGRSMNSFSVLPGENMEDGAVFTEWEKEEHLICVCAAGQQTAALRKCPVSLLIPEDTTAL